MPTLLTRSMLSISVFLKYYTNIYASLLQPFQSDQVYILRTSWPPSSLFQLFLVRVNSVLSFLIQQISQTYNLSVHCTPQETPIILRNCFCIQSIYAINLRYICYYSEVDKRKNSHPITTDSNGCGRV